MNCLGQRCFAVIQWSLVSIAVVALGCSGPKTGTSHPDGGTATGPGMLQLSRVGSGSLLVHPNEPFTLQALLSLTEHGSVPNTAVTWKLTESPGQITLSATQADTDANGVAHIQVTCVDVGQFALRADSVGATSKAVWKVNCEPVVKHLRIVA